jgi:hypothetical protein
MQSRFFKQKRKIFFLFHVYLFLQHQTWNLNICRQGSYSKYDTECMTRELCSNIQEGQETVLSFTVSTGHTCCVFKWIPEALSPQVKQMGQEAEGSHPSSAKVKKAGSYTSTFLYVAMTWTRTTLQAYYNKWLVNEWHLFMYVRQFCIIQQCLKFFFKLVT